MTKGSSAAQGGYGDLVSVLLRHAVARDRLAVRQPDPEERRLPEQPCLIARTTYGYPRFFGAYSGGHSQDFRHL
jgi:hypothetical protein